MDVFFILSILIAVSFSLCHGGYVPNRMMKGTNQSQADAHDHKMTRTEQPHTNLNWNQVNPRPINQVPQYLQPNPALHEQKLNEPRYPNQYQDRAQKQDYNHNVNQQENIQNLNQNDQDNNHNEKDRNQKNEDQILNFFDDRTENQNYNQNNQAQIQNIQYPSENKQDQSQDNPSPDRANPAQKWDNPDQNRENPAQNWDHPAQNKGKSAQNADSSAQNRQDSAQIQNNPAQNWNNPAQSRNHPVRNQEHPAQNWDHPVQNKDKPAQNKDKPAQNKDKPAWNKDKAAQNADSSAQNREVSAQNQDSPAQNRDSAVQIPNNPAQNLNNPAQTRDNPDKNQNQLQEPAQIQDQKQNEQQIPEPGYRKSLSKFKRFEIRKRADDPDDHRKVESRLPQVSMLNPDSISNLYKTISKVLTVANPEPKRPRMEDRMPAAKKGMDGIDRIEKIFRDFTSSNIPTSMIYRAQQDYDIKPSFIRFKSSDQPSLKLELTSNTIAKFLETILSSPTARRYADAAGQQAAVVFRSLSEKFPELKRLEPNEPRNEDHPVYKH